MGMTCQRRTAPGGLWSQALLLALAIGTASLRADDAKTDPKTEYQNRVATVHKRLAKAHYDIGVYCAERKCHEFARRQFERTLALAPDHEFARKRTGFRKQNGAWVKDPKAKVPQTNDDADYAAIEQVEAALRKKLADLGKRATADLVNLAEWCQTSGLEPQARLHYSEALGYDASNEKAHKALGHVRQGGAWLSEAESAARTEAAAIISAAPEGEPVADPSDAERDMGVKLNKRRSTHFTYQSTLPAASVQRQVRLAEATYAFFLKTMDIKEESLPGPFEFLRLTSLAEHVRYVDTCRNEPADIKALLRSLNEFIEGPFCESWHEGDGKIQDDATVHETVHMLLGCSYTIWRSQQAWVYEGTACWFTARLLGTAYTDCMGEEGSRESKGFERADSAAWRERLRGMVTTHEDPNISGVLNASAQTVAWTQLVKGWSLVDFFLSNPERRDRFKKFCERLGEDGLGRNQNDALKEAFEANGENLDLRWRTFVMESY